MRKKFLKSLPHVATIRKWFSNMHGGPGFCSNAFTLLHQKVEEEHKKGKQVLVAVMMDDMAIKKQIDFDSSQSRYIGFVDIGAG